MTTENTPHDCPLATLVRSFQEKNPDDRGPVWTAFERLIEVLPHTGEAASRALALSEALNARLGELHDALRACDGLPPLDRTL